MPRLTKIYTKKGTRARPSLGGGQRVAKDDLRVQVYGTVDELNSQLGVALAWDLSDAPGASPHRDPERAVRPGLGPGFVEEDKQNYTLPQIEARHVERLEALIDELTATVGPLENFILPGGTLGAAQLHVARTVCRRAEREAATLARQEGIGAHVMTYLNRLSDALFVMARYENSRGGWRSRCGGRELEPH